jgi:hypothetical protein
VNSPHFRRDYQLRAVGLKVPLKLSFPYAWDTNNIAVADKILYHAGENKVVSALWKFEHVDANIRCIAIVDRNIERRPFELRDYLRSVALIVQLEDPDAPQQLRAALGIV